MAAKGRRLYQCDDCKEKSFFHWIAFNRASRPRCPRCGCHRLELVTDEAKTDRAEKNQVRVSGGTRDTTRPVEKPNKKVT